jgi:hypothetical protein
MTMDCEFVVDVICRLAAGVVSIPSSAMHMFVVFRADMA